MKQGEVVGIIGRNGAGKSTLLKTLSRITTPTTGDVKLYGRVSSLLEVGTGFHPELTGRENIYLNGAVLGMRKAEIDRKFDEIVDFSEIEKFIDTPVKHYSSGMYVRLAFAVSAHLEPEILLVDEVLAVGDMAFQKKCLGKMGDVATKEGRTVLFVSHSMASIKQLCSRTFLLDAGRIKKSGNTEEVVASYLAEEFRSESAEYTWNDDDAPGDETAKLKTMRLCSAIGEVRSEFGTDEPIFVEVEYTVFKRVSPFRIGFSLHTIDGIYILFTSDSDIPSYDRDLREPGHYVSRCQIPANWLNVGSYFLRIEGSIYAVRIVFIGFPGLKFTVFSTGGPTSRFGEKRLGVLCPDMTWEVYTK